ncbi:MAG: LacI family DNA-binding transcriptional regulator [Gemmatimonadetes bacterium]|nr:LacI family DNA-binding transcriptional regulator [Gemmatimonadota bacterium]
MRNRPVTIKDIARRLGISYSTVSRALSSQRSHLVKERTRLLVEQAAEDMDYSPNLMAQTFVKGRGGVLGLLANRIGSEIAGRQIHHLVRTAGGHGYQVLVAAAANRTASALEDERVEQLMQLTSRDIDGILIQTIGDEAESAPTVHAAPGGLPVVTFGYAADDMTGVSLDLASGIQEVTEHLIGLGHERICFLGEVGIRADGLPALGKGYRFAMRKHGLAPRLAPVEAARTRSGYHLGKELGGRFTAFVCCCDYTALGVCRALIESGVHVPDDVAVTGCGDFEVSAYVSPSLTTLSIPFEDIAFAAVQGILRQLRGRPVPRERSFKPHLTVRESCGAR